jgi:hypothetical protein
MAAMLSPLTRLADLSTEYCLTHAATGGDGTAGAVASQVRDGARWAPIAAEPVVESAPTLRWLLIFPDEGP